jgi:hypothetical protein
MISCADIWRCSLVAAPGWACNRENMGERRTDDQGLRPRTIGHFNEPASRATRLAVFALRRYRRNPPGVGPPFVLRHIEGKKAGHGATAATAADTKCAQHQPL